MSKSKKQPDQGWVDVTLQKPHTHAGHDYKPGDKITVRAAQAEWLREQGVIE